MSSRLSPETQEQTLHFKSVVENQPGLLFSSVCVYVNTHTQKKKDFKQASEDVRVLV